MYRIRRFGIRSTAVVAGTMYFVTTLFFVALAAVFIAVAGADSGFAAGGAAGVLIGGVVVALLYGVIGAIITAIVCWIYNIVAGSVGGIQVQVELVSPPSPAPVWGPVNAGTPDAPAGSWGPPPAAGSTTSAPTTPSQTGWSAPPSTTDTAPYDPAAPRND